MKKLLLLFALIFSCHSFSQEILDNQSVIDMIEIGFEEQVIIDKIESSETNFVTTVDELKTLKEKGVMPNVLSSMIKASKQKTEIKKNNNPSAVDLFSEAPKYDDTDFRWQNGKGKLTTVQYNSGGIPVSKESIYGIILRMMTEAKFTLKNTLSFIPYKLFIFKREKSHKRLTKNDDTPYVAMLSYGGTNSYGGETEEFLTIGIDPVLDEIENSVNTQKVEDISGSDQQKFSFSKVYVDGIKVKLNGVFVFTDNYWKLDVDGSPTPIVNFENRKSLGENHWEEIATLQGVKSEMVFNGNDKKYKSDGGTLTTKAMGYTMVYVLNKVDE
jgi:hypothetical protein